MKITVEHDPRSPWIWDRAALIAACSHLGIAGNITFRQIYGLLSQTEGDLGRSGFDPNGGRLGGDHVIEVEALLDPREAASGVTWHELGHIADGERALRAGTQAYIAHVQVARACEEVDEYHDMPHEIAARAVSHQHQDDSLVLRVNDAPCYTPDFPCWRVDDRVTVVS